MGKLAVAWQIHRHDLELACQRFDHRPPDVPIDEHPMDEDDSCAAGGPSRVLPGAAQLGSSRVRTIRASASYGVGVEKTSMTSGSGALGV